MSIFNPPSLNPPSLNNLSIPFFTVKLSIAAASSRVILPSSTFFMRSASTSLDIASRVSSWASKYCCTTPLATSAKRRAARSSRVPNNSVCAINLASAICFICSSDSAGSGLISIQGCFSRGSTTIMLTPFSILNLGGSLRRNGRFLFTSAPSFSFPFSASTAFLRITICFSFAFALINPCQTLDCVSLKAPSRETFNL